MNGARIKLARKKAGFSLRDLAKEMKGLVSAQAIGKYERGEMSPSSDVMTALSKALGVSIYYLSAPQAIEIGSVEFLTKTSTTAKDRARVETEVIEWVERYLQIEEILALDTGTWACPNGMPRRVRSLEAAEMLANDLRGEWKLGIDPIPNMTELLEERGIKVLLAELPARVSGLTCLVKRVNKGDDTPVIVINRDQPLEHRRFSMAHELGHRVIGAGREGDIEKLCHRFAGAFLVNKEHLQTEIGMARSAFGVREILDLKQIYRVPAASFLVRFQQLGVLDPAAVQYAFRTYARGWRSAEPEALELPAEKNKWDEPKRFERLVYRAAAEDMISISKAIELLRRPLAEVEQGLKGPVRAYADCCE